MWVYLLIFSLICFFCFIKFKQKEIILYFFLVLLVLIAGLRDNVDKDYLLYHSMYQSCLDGNYPGEISFYLISLMVYNLFNNPVFLFFIYAVPGVSLKIFAIRKLTEFWFCSLLIYFSFFFMLHEMTQIRAGVATGFILLGIPSIYEKNFKSFLLFIGAAFLFHYSAIIIIPFYFLNKDRISRLFYFIIPFAFLLYFLNINVTSVIQLVKIDYITVKYMAYKALAESGVTTNLFNVIQLMRYIFIAILLWKWEVIAEKNKYAVLLIKFYIIGSFLMIIFADIPAISFRFSELFTIVEFIVIPFFIYFFKTEFQGAIVVSLIALGIMANVLFYEKLLLAYF